MGKALNMKQCALRSILATYPPTPGNEMRIGKRMIFFIYEWELIIFSANKLLTMKLKVNHGEMHFDTRATSQTQSSVNCGNVTIWKRHVVMYMKWNSYMYQKNKKKI